MNKYKNKALYISIPIKPAVLFYLSKVASYFFSLCFVVLALNNNNSVIVLYITPPFTHSSLVLNLKEFSSAEPKCYFKERGKPNRCWSSVIFFLLSKSTWTSNCLVTHVLQNTLFCVQHKKEMNTGLGQHVSE